MVGSLSAVGNIVYVAEFTNNSTNGFTMKSGRQVFHYTTGTYTPVISDGRRIYLTGYSSITALQPQYKTRCSKARGGEAAAEGQGRPTRTEARAPPPTSAPRSSTRKGTRTGREARKRVRVKS